MLVQKFLFPRDKLAKKILYLLILFSLLPIASSCSGKKVWDIPLTQFSLKLRNGDYTFLQHIDYTKVDLKEVRRLDPNAPFYFYFIFRKLGLRDISEKMLELAYKSGIGIWKERAGLILLKGLVKKHKYEKALKIADSILLEIKDNNDDFIPKSDIAQLRRLKIESLYWLKRDQEVIKFIKLYTGMKDSSLSLSSDRELNLFLAVSSCRLGKEGWREDFKRLYFRFYSSFVHSRGYAFLKKKEERLKGFDPFTLEVFKFKDLVGRGLKSNALKLGEEIIRRNVSEVSSKIPLLIKELGFLYLSLGEYNRGIKFLLTVYPGLVGMARLNGMEMLGRIYRKAKKYKEAIFYLKKVANATLDKAQRDRVNWFIIDMYLKYSAKKAQKYITDTYPYWSNYRYFEDVLNSLTSKLVGLRQWDAIYRLYGLVRKSGPLDIKNRLLFIVDIAIKRGLITPDFKDQIKLNSDTVDTLKDDSGDYYVLMLGILEKELLRARISSKENSLQFHTTVSESPSPSHENSNFYDFIKGFFDFGLNGEGYFNLMKNDSLLSGEELLKIADTLNKRGVFRQSINIVGLYLSRMKRGIEKISTDENLRRLYYPKAYAEAIIDNAKRYSIPEYVLFALVREESYFDSGIVSRAGAVGLTQLLPVTARDVARKLGVKEPDLKNPVVNIELGARHLSDLYKRLNSMTKALIAYNAGLSRLRKWERGFKDLDDILFLEALPFSETREYVKKIIVSSVYYSSLNTNNVIRYYFGEF